MLIAGRLIQGLRGAGITAMTQLIISDLVSLRERGKYIGVIYAVFGLGTAVAPPLEVQSHSTPIGSGPFGSTYQLAA